ncbi:geranylgeranyl diphosphate synthase type I [Barrientosiimonas humi]|uniref:Geranylgeranyl diphosphate synthase type I n=1 Tax=Barrientosiimonas humi TaxID=999931 RepID=A0A542XAR4_9MICO|nr:polyprenyl synthetase family protein [Barrientosiimonas humi]TQL32935.1 geranylgeranyl diphosphate synthase type I [Barrientosiimonas humi]CAG7572925.1 Octaprenyl-diphosphate synthase [Barrientosiimonas humi]
MPNPLDVERLRTRVQTSIDAQLKAQQQVLAPIGTAAEPLLQAAADLLRGGKRLRAAFFYWGYRAAGGADSDALVTAASSMEMFQAGALVHDDVMDDSDTRRGQPSVHRRLGRLHADRSWLGDTDRFGAAGAVLVGDLCLTWTDELYATSGLPAEELARGRGEFDAMRAQLMAGQFLDVLEAALGWDDAPTDERIARARHVARVKSARYTVEQPLLIGAACAGGDEALLDDLARYGRALGEAFQLRDDLLGVFGDPAATGKPAGDDLREGKRTVLMAYTLDALDDADTERFEALLGDADLADDDLAWMRDTITGSGAVERVERLIDELVDVAAAALRSADIVDDQARTVLGELVTLTTERNA